MVAILEKGEFNTEFHPMMDFIAASPLRRNPKLRDEDGIVSIPDTELFENLTLMGPKSTGFNEFSSNIAIALVCLATNRTYNFSKMIFDGMVKNVNNKISKFLMYPRFLTICLRMSQFGQITHTHKYVGEGSGTPTEPHHTPSPEADTSHPTTLSIPLPSIPTALIPSVTQTNTTLIKQYSRRARIAQSSALPTIADEPASPMRYVTPRVTSPAADKGSMQHIISELTALCTSLQRKHSELLAKFQAQEVEILRLKERVQVLEKREGVAAKQSRDDASIKGRRINEGDAAAERINNDLEDIARVLTSMDAAIVLAGGIDVPTSSGSIPTAGPSATVISIGSEVGPTASLIVGPTASQIVTSYSRRKGKEVMVESDTPKKQRLQEQIDAQVARDLEEQQKREDMRMNEQIARDAEVARIHAKEELQGMIDRLDRSNETMAKYLQEYQDFASELPFEKRIELISDQVEDFIPMGSKEEAERLKRKGFNLEQEHVKKQKSSEQAHEMEKSIEEITKEKMKEMMQLVPVEDVYVQALQVKHPIIDWNVHIEGQRSYWKIIRLGGSSACYQFFIDLLKQLDREDLNQLWALVKEYLSIRPATSEKEMEL
nr:leucine-rich repeat protein [Tanacetum cinerariifolium]